MFKRKDSMNTRVFVIVILLGVAAVATWLLFAQPWTSFGKENNLSYAGPYVDLLAMQDMQESKRDGEETGFHVWKVDASTGLPIANTMESLNDNIVVQARFLHSDEINYELRFENGNLTNGRALEGTGIWSSVESASAWDSEVSFDVLRDLLDDYVEQVESAIQSVSNE